MKIHRMLFLLALICSMTLLSCDELYLRTHHSKTEYMIPMRDGTKLFTIVYAPKDQSQKYPILMTRTAYGIAPYGPDEFSNGLGPNKDFDHEGYIFVHQDARGRFKSQGEFIHHRPYLAGQVNEATDTYDTIDWLIKHIPNNNGRVGQWGISWAGWEVSQGMIEAHPALRASSPQSPPQDQFLGDDHHSGGAFQLMYAFSWMAANAHTRPTPTDKAPKQFDYGTSDGYDFFLKLGSAANAQKFFLDQFPTWNEYMRHGTYDAYWQSRNVPKDLRHVHHPVLLVGGWFDAQDFYGAFRMYEALRRYSPANQTYFVLGPWAHGGYAGPKGDQLGAIDFGSTTSRTYRYQMELPFFNYYLKNKGHLTLPRVQAFITGQNRWYKGDVWPPLQARPQNLYLAEQGRLTFQPSPSTSGSDSYRSDPAKPVPYSAQVGTNEGDTFMVEDQRFATVRNDVLTYQSVPLIKDFTIAGSIEASLHIATSGTDADYIVKVIDVYPDDAPDFQGTKMGGYQMLLTGDILRAKFRNSFAKPEPLVPGQVTKLVFPLGDKFHTFRKGHRIMVQIQSSWFPMFDRNPQTFVDIYHAGAKDYQAATQTIFRSVATPSFIRVNVLP